MTSPSNPVRSMTGFAAERCPTRLGELSISLRGVNHRGLDLHFHGSSELSVFENEMRALLKNKIARGHIEVRAALTRVVDGQATYNRDALARHLAAFRQASDEFGLHTEPDLNRLFAISGILSESTAGDHLPDSFLPELLDALERCTQTLNQHREREGEALRNDMAKQAAEIDRCTREIAAIRDEARPHFEARLREKLSELLSSSSITESRLVEEAALISDRSDIQEELVRLKIHTAELTRLLAAGGEIGKRLDFLLQEMNREINTALSKSANAGEPGLRITNLALSIKANIERIREQGLNLE
jgi:uncharacterized protein (TIGR00255 family)